MRKYVQIRKLSIAKICGQLHVRAYACIYVYTAVCVYKYVYMPINWNVFRHCAKAQAPTT